MRLKLLFLVALAVLATACDSYNPERIRKVYFSALANDGKDVSSSEIDFLTGQVELILDDDIKILDEIIEEPNKAKRADLTIGIEDKLHLDELEMAYSVLKKDAVQDNMEYVQQRKFRALKKKAESVYMRIKLVGDSFRR